MHFACVHSWRQCVNDFFDELFVVLRRNVRNDPLPRQWNALEIGGGEHAYVDGMAVSDDRRESSAIVWSGDRRIILLCDDVAVFESGGFDWSAQEPEESR